VAVLLKHLLLHLPQLPQHLLPQPLPATRRPRL
jgi:hypothetical protein